jgi:uncharacterized membrane protein
MIFNTGMPGFFANRKADKRNRPAGRPAMEPVDWLLEAAALAGILTLLGVVIYQFPRLPAIIPSHFNAAGLPDDYSPKATIWTLPAIGIVVYALLSLVALVPQQFNYPVTITATNALRQYKLATRLVRYLKAAIMWLFFYISYTTVMVTAKESSGMGLWSMPVILVGIIGPVIIYVIIAGRNKNRQS